MKTSCSSYYSSSSSHGQAGQSSSSQGQARHGSSYASSSSYPIAEHSSSHASSSSYATDGTGDATVNLAFTITVGHFSIDLSNQQNSSEVYANAFHELHTSSFNEIMENCKRELMRYKLGVCSDPLSNVLNEATAAAAASARSSTQQERRCTLWSPETRQGGFQSGLHVHEQVAARHP